MSRIEEKSGLFCPICNEELIKDISGEFALNDHDYGFGLHGEADGYYCENDHRIMILTSDEEDDEN